MEINFTLPDDIHENCIEVMEREPFVMIELKKYRSEETAKLISRKATLRIELRGEKEGDKKAMIDLDKDVVALVKNISKIEAMIESWNSARVSARAFYNDLTKQ